MNWLQPEKSTNKVREDYDKIAGHFAQTRQKPTVELDFFKPYIQEDQHILDIGCGTGRVYGFLNQALARFNYQGIDISTEQLKEFKKNFPESTVQAGNALHLPLPDNSFDVVFMVAVLHHLPSSAERLQALQEANRALRSGGIICLTNWNLWQSKFWKKLPGNFWRTIRSGGKYSVKDFFIPWKNEKGEQIARRYYYAFTRTKIKKLSQKAGFTILENCYTKGSKLSRMWDAYNITTILKKA